MRIIFQGASVLLAMMFVLFLCSYQAAEHLGHSVWTVFGQVVGCLAVVLIIFLLHENRRKLFRGGK